MPPPKKVISEGNRKINSKQKHMSACVDSDVVIDETMPKTTLEPTCSSVPSSKSNDNMAKLKSEVDKWVSMPDKDYLELIEDHILLTALRAAGIERLPIYKSAQSILKNNHIEVHLKPIKYHYK